jgi:hypothetical protein
VTDDLALFRVVIRILEPDLAMLVDRFIDRVDDVIAFFIFRLHPIIDVDMPAKLLRVLF